MTISHVASQGARVSANNNTAVSLAYPGNVSAGSLLTIAVCSAKFSIDDSIASDLAKSAGTATIGTPTLDAQVQISNNLWCAVWSVIVTGAGSLTLTASNFPASSNLTMYVDEFAGTWDATRVEDANSLGSNAGVAPLGPNMTSAGAALFFGGIRIDALGLTPQGAFTEVATVLDESHAIYRIVGTGTTDAIEWTAPSGASWAIAGAVYKEGAAGGAAVKTMHLHRQMRN
jgi:hypothetical protein